MPLLLCLRDATNIMKAGETEKVKRYSALCWTERAVTQDELDRLLTRSEVRRRWNEMGRHPKFLTLPLGDCSPMFGHFKFDLK